MAILVNDRVPCVRFEDAALLVVEKPPGINTHSAEPYQSEGIYEWLKHRNPEWSQLSIVHRLDKGTSGLLVLAKTSTASRALVEQFERRSVRKKYLLVTASSARAESFRASSILVRAGEKYWSRPTGAKGDQAVTTFRKLRQTEGGWLWEARPETGRTHQVRVHASDHGIPILGDELYGGAAAPRLCLHCEETEFRHPTTGEPLRFASPAQFEQPGSLALRAGLIDSEATTAYRLIHGASDGCPGWYVDRLGDFLLSQAAQTLNQHQLTALTQLAQQLGLRGVMHKTESNSSPALVWGEAWPERFEVRENGIQFEVRPGSTLGLFLDQRDNRRRLLAGHVAAGFPLRATQPAAMEVLNLFAHTCSLSVAAAMAGGRTTNVDLSRTYLDWGKRNFELNSLRPTEHKFLTGDAFDWLDRLRKKGQQFDLVLVDPPTFSRSKSRGTFATERDFAKLVAAAGRVVRPGGVLFASCNTARLEPKAFVETVQSAAAAIGCKILQQHYAPQPPDFSISRSEPGYLKTIWVRLGRA